MPTPYWTSDSDFVGLSGGPNVSVACPADAGFKMSSEQLDDVVTPKTKWVLLNSASNPTGAIYPKQEFQALATVLMRHPHIWKATEEIYAHLSYILFTAFRKAAPSWQTVLSPSMASQRTNQ